MLLLYNLLWFVLCPLIFLLFPLISALAGKKRSGLLQYFGLIHIDREEINRKNIIWIQAISVGEVVTAVPVVEELKSSIANFGYVVSVTTESGYQRAKKSFPDALAIFYTPLDFYPFISRLIKKIRPSAILVIETGFWPNLISCGKKNGAVPVLINARISGKSFRNYKAISPLSRTLFNMFDILITRDPTVTEMFKQLRVDETKILSFGDVKYDTLLEADNEDMGNFRKIFSIIPGEKVIMAGNTHEGEEEFMLDVYDELKNHFNNILLIIAPRRIERLPRIEKILSDRRRPYVRRTALGFESPREADIIILDTIGELSKIYFICDIIFVGKSIFPPGGGHSLLEPVTAGKVAFHGPYVHYQEDRGLLQKAGLAVELNEKPTFIDCFSRILKNEEENKDALQKAAVFLGERKGASKKIVEIIQSELERLTRK